MTTAAAWGWSPQIQWREGLRRYIDWVQRRFAVIRVAFVLADAGDTWLGGVNYYRNLLSALRLLGQLRVQPVIFVGTKVSETFEKNFKGEEIVQSRLFDSGSFHHFSWKTLNKIFSGRNILLGRLLARHNIDVLSHFGIIPRRSKIKRIGWIPDFQHIHFPGFFSKCEIARRNKAFARISISCDRILLSSESALKDLSSVSPEALLKSRLLRFIPEINPQYLRISLFDLELKYEFSGPYFHLPNQFWIHKNHKTVIETLAKLKHRVVAVPTIIATGKEGDYRFPQHFNDLMIRIQNLGLHNNFRSLGVVPYEDMLALMRYSVAVINPSLFEGWSSTVEEAKALGKIILLSDLPVHREQNPEHGIFFSPTDADELSRAMLVCLANSEPTEVSDRKIENDADYLRNRIDFARRYQEIVVELVSGSLCHAYLHDDPV